MVIKTNKGKGGKIDSLTIKREPIKAPHTPRELIVFIKKLYILANKSILITSFIIIQKFILYYISLITCVTS